MLPEPMIATLSCHLAQTFPKLKEPRRAADAGHDVSRGQRVHRAKRAGQDDVPAERIAGRPRAGEPRRGLERMAEARGAGPDRDDRAIGVIAMPQV